MNRKFFTLLLAACAVWLLPMGALAATFQAADGAQLQTALTSAADGDTIELVGTLTDLGAVTLDKALTISGGTVTGNSSFRLSGGQDVTFTGVTFRDIHNSTSNLSAIYATDLSGSLTVTGSTFENIDWDAIQVTPVAGAQITVTDSVFRDDDPAVRQQRYVHIQSAMNTALTATVTGNKMFGNLAQEALGVYYPADPAKQDLKGNFIADTMTYPVCILNGTGENIAQIAYPQVNENGQIRADQVLLGKSEFYATAYPSLAAAAAAGETDLVLIRDAALTENVDFPEGTTLDLNNQTLTLAPGVSLPDTVTVVENGGQVTQQPNIMLLLWGLLLAALLAALAWVLIVGVTREDRG